MKVIFKPIIAIAMFLFMGCGEKSPQNLRLAMRKYGLCWILHLVRC